MRGVAGLPGVAQFRVEKGRWRDAHDWGFREAVGVGVEAVTG